MKLPYENSEFGNAVNLLWWGNDLCREEEWRGGRAEKEEGDGENEGGKGEKEEHRGREGEKKGKEKEGRRREEGPVVF